MIKSYHRRYLLKFLLIYTDIQIFIFDNLFLKEIFYFKYFNEISYSYPNIATQREYVFILTYMKIILRIVLAGVYLLLECHLGIPIILMII